MLGEKPVHGFLAAVLPASIASSPTALLTLAAVSVVAIAVLLQVHGLTVWALETWLGDRLVLDLRAKVFRHLQRLSLTFHEAKSGAEAALPRAAGRALDPLGARLRRHPVRGLDRQDRRDARS